MKSSTQIGRSSHVFPRKVLSSFIEVLRPLLLSRMNTLLRFDIIRVNNLPYQKLLGIQQAKDGAANWKG